MAKSSRRRAAATARPYHHGNLAPALVEAALALLDETQDWAFSLREVARRAGVSHNAPYKHFPEKRDLLAAVAARGFDALAERTLAALVGVEGARARIIACGRAFAAHGIANPALYRLMFGAVLTSPESGRPAL
ncbi:MAG: TetR/AcrR family transcriptional regulator, partial [Xanthobacteraceae bacterium]